MNESLNQLNIKHQDQLNQERDGFKNELAKAHNDH